MPASFYWQGKMPAAAFFTTVPFGLTPAEHVAWIDAGGGQALWDELYAPFAGSNDAPRGAAWLWIANAISARKCYFIQYRESHGPQHADIDR